MAWLIAIARVLICLVACALGVLCVYGCYSEAARCIKEAAKGL